MGVKHAQNVGCTMQAHAKYLAFTWNCLEYIESTRRNC